MEIDQEFIRARIAERFGGNGARLANALGLHRSTVSRWLSRSAKVCPHNGDALLALAVALDVDPFLLWTFRDDAYPEVCARMRDARWRNEWGGEPPALSFLSRFFGPDARDAWPPAALAAPYGRPWTVRQFEHRPSGLCGQYGGRVVRGQVNEPQVWHVTSVAAGQILPPAVDHLGFVRWARGELTMHNYNGQLIRHARAPSPRFGLEVWLGPRARTFTLASLHPFELDEGAAEPTARFCLCAHDCTRLDVARPCPLLSVCSAGRLTHAAVRSSA
jgi:transcriptional regulator with XRE-family HTH domain